MEESTIKNLIERVPQYREFLTVDELDQSDRELAENYSDDVRLRLIGESRRGFPIQALEIGEGRHQALLFGFPHPEEPSGSLVLKYLAERLAEDKDLKKSFNYTWSMVKCIDPDGARLNEAWFKDFSVKNFALSFFRPPSHRQVEWSFPVKYRSYEWNNPIPETKAIMNLIDRAKPDFMSSLHMSPIGFGGVYFYASENYPSLHQKFYNLVRSQHLPLHLGEPEVPYRVKFADAIFRMPVFEDSYDYFMNQLGNVPEALKRGTSSYGYARNISNPYTLITEVSFLFNKKAADTTPTGIERKNTKVQEIQKRYSAYRFIQNQFKKVVVDLDKESPFYEVISEYLARTQHALKAELQWVKTDPSIWRKATEAETFDSTIGVILDELCYYGVFLRLLKASIPKTTLRTRIKRAIEEVRNKIEETYEEFEKKAEYKIIPIQKLVRIQLGSLLYSVQYLESRRVKQ